jgi:hypothetical protein
MLSLGKSLSVLAVFVSNAISAPSATSLFKVDFASDAQGGCNYVGESMINDFLDDSIALAKAGVQLCQDYRAQKDEAKRLADALFKVNTAGGSIDKVEGTSRLSLLSHILLTQFPIKRCTKASSTSCKGTEN